MLNHKELELAYEEADSLIFGMSFISLPRNEQYSYCVNGWNVLSSLAELWIFFILFFCKAHNVVPYCISTPWQFRGQQMVLFLFCQFCVVIFKILITTETSQNNYVFQVLHSYTLLRVNIVSLWVFPHYFWTLTFILKILLTLIG